MRRRLVTFMTLSVLALALGAAPAMADSHGDSHGDHWVVLNRTSTDLRLFPTDEMNLMLSCGAHSYTLVSGFVDQLEMAKGTYAGGAIVPGAVAAGPGQGFESWTLRDVKVRSNQTHRVYSATGSSRYDATWQAGFVYGSGAVDPTSQSWVQDAQVNGTRDGRSFRWAGVPIDLKFDRGTCSNLQLGFN